MSRTKRNRPKNNRGYRFSVKIDKLLKTLFTDDEKFKVAIEKNKLVEIDHVRKEKK